MSCGFTSGTNHSYLSCMTDDCIIISNNNLLRGTSLNSNYPAEWSISFWFKTNGWAGADGILHMIMMTTINYIQCGMKVHKLSSNQLQAVLYDQYSNVIAADTLIVTNTTLAAGTWYHLVINGSESTITLNFSGDTTTAHTTSSNGSTLPMGHGPIRLGSASELNASLVGSGSYTDSGIVSTNILERVAGRYFEVCFHSPASLADFYLGWTSNGSVHSNAADKDQYTHGLHFNTDGSITLLNNNQTGTGFSDSSGNKVVPAASSELIPGLSAYWNFDSNTGTTVTDLVAGTYNGTWTGSSVWGTGKFGPCGSFDGSSKYVTLPNSSPSFTNGITIAGWINLNNLTGRQTIISNGGSSANGSATIIQLQSNSSALFMEWASNTNYQTVSGGTLTANTWHHAAFTYNPTNGYYALYLDGASVGTGNVTAASMNGTLNNSLIGAAPGPARYLTGLIDDLRIYNTPLTASEVQLLYNHKPSTWTPATNYRVRIQLGASPDFLGTSTTLTNAGGISSSATSMTVASASNFPSSGNYAVTIDSEVMMITAGQGTTTWTLQRGIYNTTAAAHAQNANVVQGTGAIFYIQGGQFAPLFSEQWTILGVDLLTNQTNIFPAVNMGNGTLTLFYACVRDSQQPRNWMFDDGSRYQIQPINTVGSPKNTPYEIWTSKVGTWAQSSSGIFNVSNTTGDLLTIPFQANNTNSIPGLIGYWAFDEGFGTKASDLSGTNYVSTWSGTGQRWGVGKFGPSGAVFNGVDDQITAVTSNPVSIANGLTFAAWINPTTVSGRKQFFNNNDGNAPTVLSIQTNNTNIWFELGINNVYYYNVSGTVSAGSWQHVACTFDASSGNYALYINGSQVTTAVLASGTVSALISTVLIGNANSIPYAGGMDDVRFYNRALSATEISQLYNYQAPSTIAGYLAVAEFLHNSNGQNLQFVAHFQDTNNYYFIDIPNNSSSIISSQCFNGSTQTGIVNGSAVNTTTKDLIAYILVHKDFISFWCHSTDWSYIQYLGGLNIPILTPSSSIGFYVQNQGASGVTVINPVAIFKNRTFYEPGNTNEISGTDSTGSTMEEYWQVGFINWNARSGASISEVAVAGNPFLGYIADLCFYDRKLSLAEISLLRNLTKIPAINTANTQLLSADLPPTY